MFSNRHIFFALGLLCSNGNCFPQAAVLALVEPSTTIISQGEKSSVPAQSENVHDQQPVQHEAGHVPDNKNQNQIINGENEHEFCHGKFETMFMDGFHVYEWGLSAAYSHHSSDDRHPSSNSTSTTPPCLAYYVKTWRLDVSGKFRGAMVFSFLLALLTEGLSRGRFALIQFIHHDRQHERHRKVLLTVVYALQQWLGTMIMLVSMMYSIELLLSVVAGLTAGNFLFMRESDSNQTTTATAAAANMMGPASLTSQAPLSAAVAGHGAANSSSSGGRRVIASLGGERQSLLSPAPMCCLDDNGSGGGLQMLARKDD